MPVRPSERANFCCLSVASYWWRLNQAIKDKERYARRRCKQCYVKHSGVLYVSICVSLHLCISGSGCVCQILVCNAKKSQDTLSSSSPFFFPLHLLHSTPLHSPPLCLSPAPQYFFPLFLFLSFLVFQKHSSGRSGGICIHPSIHPF